MNMDQDELIIKKALNTVHTPEYNMNHAVLRELQRPKRSLYIKRVIPITSIIIVMLVCSVGVSAAYFPSFNQLLSIVSPKMALMLQPIEQSSEDVGMKMEVVAAMTDEDMALIYVTLEDITGDRLDETVDLFDSYSLTGATILNSELVDYDKEAKKATFRIQANGGEFLNNQKVKFEIRSFLSHKKTFNEVKVNTNLTDIQQNIPQTIFLDEDYSSGGGGNSYKTLYENGKTKILQPFENEVLLPNINFMHISNIGFIDNQLHVQAKWKGKNLDNHGYFYLADSLGNKVLPTNISFGIGETGQLEYGSEMEEYIFDMKNVDISKQKLMGDFVANAIHTEGNWSTTFKIQPIKDEKKMQFRRDFGTWTSTSMIISPFGVTLTGNGDDSDSSHPSVKIKMKDGSVRELDSFVSYSENNKVKLKVISSLPFDVSKVKSVVVDSNEIDVR
ncbi:hypothetical protein [Bacillus massiliigorillae]|uniref:hypothetical protein n=1 Tax=Bacillus massiliigorillae TaxID=1243664 RepID=UPI0005A8AFFF|nr:hypothetical protein [Bacillus massiliigorillae]